MTQRGTSIKAVLFNWKLALPIALVFLLDCLDVSSCSVTRFYLPCLLLAYRLKPSNLPLRLAGLCTFLTLLGFAISRSNHSWQMGIESRAADILLIWIVAAFVSRISESSFSHSQLAKTVEQKQAELNVEKSLRQSESRYRTFIDHASDAIFVYDGKGIVQDVNRRACESLGYSREELIGKSPPFFARHVSSDFMSEVIRKLYAGETVTFESVHRHKDKGELQVEVRICPFEVDGQSMALGIARDITDRKRAEVELRNSERQLRELANAIPQIVWTAGADGGMLHLNRRATEYSGVSIDELTGWSWEHFVHSDDIARTLQSWTTTIRTGIPQDVEVRLRKSDGVYRWHICRQSPGRNAAGEITVWYGTCTDIEEQKQTEVALRMERDRFQTIAATAPGLICSLLRRADGTFAFPYISSPILKDYGLKPDFLSKDASPIFKMVHRNDEELIHRTLAESASTLVPWRESFRLYHPTRGMIWIEAHGRPTRHDDGSTEWYGFVTDVTRKQLAKIELDRQQKELNLIFDTVPALIFFKDVDHKLIRVNKEFERILGRSQNEIEGKTSADLESPYAEQYQRDEDEIIASGKPKLGIIEPVLTKSGTRWLRTDKIPTRNESGEVIGVVGFSVDITERKLAEEALIDSDARLRSIGSNLPDGVIFQYQRWPDERRQFIYFTRGLEHLLGVTSGSLIADADRLYSIIDRDDFVRLDVLERHSFQSLASVACEFRVHAEDGKVRWLHSRSSPRRQPDGSAIWDGVMIDITERKQAEHVITGQNRVMERIATGSSLSEILEQTVELIEDLLPSTLCSILLYKSEENRLRFGAGRGLPSEYSQAVDGIIVGPCSGSCGTAVFRREPVVVSDISTDPLWVDYRDLAESHGLRSCWSVPIFSRGLNDEHHSSPRVLGTFAIYRSEPWEPRADDAQIVATATYLAGIAIERDDDVQSLRASEKNLANAQRIARLGSWVWDLETNRMSASDEVFRLFETSREDSEPSFDVFINAVHPDDREFVELSIQKALSEQSRYDLDYRIVRADKQILFVHAQGEFVFNSQGRAIRLDGVIVDISERKQAEAALRESQQRLRLIFETVAAGLIVRNADGKITDCNTEAERILGITAEELIDGIPTDPQLVTETSEPFIEELQPANITLRTGKPIRDVTMGVLKKCGELSWISVNTAPQFDLQDRVSMVVSCFSDITAIKNAQDALKKSEARFARIFQSVPTMMAICTHPDGRFVDINPFFSKLIEYNVKEVVGRCAVDLGIWPDPHQREELVAAIERNESVRGIERIIRSKSGQLFTVLTSVEPIEFGGEPCLLFVHHDITERKQTEEKLHSTEKRLAMFFRSSPVGICISSLEDGTILEVNDVYLEIAQSTAEETIGRTSIELGWWVDPIERKTMTGVLKTHGSLKNCELAHVRKDGTIGYTLRSFERLTIDGQECILTMFHEVTDRKRAEEKLRATENRLSTLFRASPVGICISTLDEGIVIDANDAYINIAGYCREEVIGTPTVQFGQWPEQKQHSELVMKLKSHGSVKNWEIAFRRKDGTIGYSLRSFERLMLDGLDCILTLVTDTTERKKIDEELKSNRRRLEVLSRQLISAQENERRHLARELHDEIGQILTAIKMNIRKTQRFADPALKLNLDENVAMVDHAIGQVRNLSLSLRPPQLDQLGLVAALHWVVKYQAQIGGFHECLETDIGNLQVSDDIAIVCFRITQEALTNTVRHANAQNVRVELNIRGTELCLAIEDDGEGFDIESARQRADAGSSMGLLSMQERVGLVGGRYCIESIIGKGTKIRSCFPIIPLSVTDANSTTKQTSQEYC